MSDCIEQLPFIFPEVPKTAQEYYDALYDSCYNGNFPAIELRPNPNCIERNDFMCCYRNKKGQKCAAGLLIPDNNYQPLMENSPISNYFSMLSLPEGIDSDNIHEIQRYHDAPYQTSSINQIFDPVCFINNINSMLCFSKVNRREPK